MAHKPFPAKAHQPFFQYSLILSKSSSSSETDYTSLSELLRLSVLSYGNIYHTWCFTSKVESSLLFLLNFLDANDFCHTWCFTCSAVPCCAGSLGFLGIGTSMAEEKDAFYVVRKGDIFGILQEFE